MLLLLLVLVALFIIVGFIFTSLPIQSAFSLPNLWLFLKNKRTIQFIYIPIITFFISKYFQFGVVYATGVLFWLMWQIDFLFHDLIKIVFFLKDLTDISPMAMKTGPGETGNPSSSRPIKLENNTPEQPSGNPSSSQYTSHPIFGINYEAARIFHETEDVSLADTSKDVAIDIDSIADITQLVNLFRGKSFQVSWEFMVDYKNNTNMISKAENVIRYKAWETGIPEGTREERILRLNLASLKDMYLLLYIINTSDVRYVDFNTWKNRLFRPDLQGNPRPGVLDELKKLANIKHSRWVFRNAPEGGKERPIIPIAGEGFILNRLIDGARKINNRTKFYGELDLYQKTFNPHKLPAESDLIPKNNHNNDWDVD